MENFVLKIKRPLLQSVYVCVVVVAFFQLIFLHFSSAVFFVYIKLCTAPSHAVIDDNDVVVVVVDAATAVVVVVVINFVFVAITK